MEGIEHILSDGSTMLKQEELVMPHVESFNWIMDSEGGFDLICKYMKPLVINPSEFKDIGNPQKVQITVEKLMLMPPGEQGDSADPRIFPTECRQRRITYAGNLIASVSLLVGDGYPRTHTVDLGAIPVMVKSKACHLYKASQAELIRRKEDPNEPGGYFIINGNERLIRLIINRRRNVVVAESRKFYENKNKGFSQYGTTLRSVLPDHSSANMTMHYLMDGNVSAGFYVNRQEFFIPASLILNALIETSDQQIFNGIVQGDAEDSFVKSRADILVKSFQRFPRGSQHRALAYIGEKFRIVCRYPDDIPDAKCGQMLLDDFVLIHLQSSQEKFDLILYMIRKLYKLVSGKILPDNVDSLQFHEAMLPGHLYCLFIKACIQKTFLGGLRRALIKEISGSPDMASVPDGLFFSVASRVATSFKTQPSNFLATGNISNALDIAIPQYSGLAIMAERLNHLRFLCHFRSIHRGQFFTTMKTTAVRKLLPESWGFLCPVHTPDGSPCGLLNHLSAPCRIMTHSSKVDEKQLRKVLQSIGMVCQTQSRHFLPVLLNGKLIGSVEDKLASAFASQLRHLKVQKETPVPSTLEIVAILNYEDRFFPSILLSTDPARFMRPVRNLSSQAIETISPFEQVFLGIACTDDDLRKGDSTHQEVSSVNMLSMLASCTPFSDFNQSPRNMYQCQMAKQTMGTPTHSYPFRTDNKMYRIQTPQKPIVRNNGVDEYELDDNPVGTNAVVAVLSYTGYDMEDAMIVNKSAYERGFGHGSVYTTIVEDLTPDSGYGMFKAKEEKKMFCNLHPITKKVIDPRLDSNGIARIGDRVEKDDPLCAIVDEVSGEVKIVKHKSTEPAFVDSVSLVAPDSKKHQKLIIKLRFNRNPVIGDKFSSRHGQKGVLSQLWPHIDMPFTEEGITPDVIINPHAFPSRMTIGMLIESIAGKAGCLKGEFQNSTPFQFSEKRTAIDEFGHQLKAFGFNSLGNEKMYSGVSGEPLEAEIFIGVVYYQRLRHMVSDKFQVRSTGPVNQLTHQPVKGRKKGGGIRLGEMERDALIGHGASYLLQDRLMHCSDKHTVHVCTSCSSINGLRKMGSEVLCQNCGESKHVKTVTLPYIFVYMANEMLSTNIKVNLEIQ